MRPLSLWAGVECTLNRVGDKYVDQCEMSGHRRRIADLELFAELGVECIRYPCLWETAAPCRPEEFDWTWTDERLPRLKELGLKPIAGLLHHGSGPRYTKLIDPSFPEKFARYARAFAERYPWVDAYTPINEPLTTARFSCLYGVWYPHLRDDMAFTRAMFLQVKATILAMRAIREVNPRAHLIQTEDMGRAQSTPPLRDQCAFENERRWLSFDLLSGRVNKSHPLYDFLRNSGMNAADFEWLAENATPPDILGINHYPLSNRYLDHRLERYPECLHGGNGRQRYADAGAIDVPGVTSPTPAELLLETWNRFAIPVAVTEVHRRGFRESQLGWFTEVWNAAESARGTGADVRAVTAWSLLGSYDWNSLCTRPQGFYEPGVFDVRFDEPRPTALARALKKFARRENPDHPLLHRPILIAGARGTLGRAFARICQQRNLKYFIASRKQMDITDPLSVDWAMDILKPWAVINAAGYVKVDEAERDHERCFLENSRGAATLARACMERALPLLTFSSDLVFDGTREEPYTESHPVSPLNVYGRSKAESESQVLNIHSAALVVRTSSFFGPWDEYNFITRMLTALARRRPVDAVSDVRISPTYVPDLVHVCLDMLIDGETGIFHLANKGSISWSGLAQAAVDLAPEGLRLDRSLIIEKKLDELRYPAKRPRQSVLASERMHALPSLEDALGRYFRELEIQIHNLKHQRELR